MNREDLTKLLNERTEYEWEYHSDMMKTWRYLVSFGGRTTSVLIPMEPTDKQFREAIVSAAKYFNFFGDGKKI